MTHSSYIVSRMPECMKPWGKRKDPYHIDSDLCGKKSESIRSANKTTAQSCILNVIDTI